ncbi:MAG: SPOR domain-containing protein [Proteobacteria bacterium]|nr:SPOR domain-containing protein [Pseudomonadota bacterium]
MYKDFFSMARDPFAIHPSPDNYFGSRSHDQALHLLIESVKEGEPYILVTGEYGAGKTLLCLKLCRFFETETDLSAVTVSSPAAPYGQLLKSIAAQLEVTGVTNFCKTVAQFEATLFNFFISGKIRQSVYLVIDDLQDYEPQMLVHFRYLTNFHIRDFYPFRLICFSYTGFIEELQKNPKFVSFLQRFRRRLNIQPLQEDELKEYIYFRLLQAGAKGRPFFDDDSLQCIANITGRIPRLVNNLCDRLLLQAVELKVDRIHVQLVRDVCRSDELERMPHAIENKISIEKERNVRIATKRADISINLDSIATDYDDNQEKEIQTSSPLAWITRRHLKTSAIILGAVLLLISLIFLMDLSQINGNPFTPTKSTIGHQSVSSRDGSGDQASSATVKQKGNKISEKPDDRYVTQTKDTPIGENTLDSRIKIHQMTAVNSSDWATEASILPGEKPYTLEVFSGSTLADIETELRRLKDKGLAPLFISEVGSSRIVAQWSICLGNFPSLQDAQNSVLMNKVPQAEVRFLPYSLLLSLATIKEDAERLQKTLEVDGYHPWLERLENGQYRLLMGAYSRRKEAVLRVQELREEGIAASVVRK